MCSSDLAAKHMADEARDEHGFGSVKEDRSFKSAQVAENKKLGLGKSVNEVAMAMPPAITPPAIVGQQRAGIMRRGGTATGKFVNPMTARATAPGPKTGTAIVKAGNRLPSPAKVNVPAPTPRGAVTAAPGAPKEIGRAHV